MLTDSHCHIYKEYYSDIDRVINNSISLGVNRFINNGVDRKTNREVLKLINIYPNMYGAIGIHPEYSNSYQDSDIAFIEENLSNPKVIAIGEIGLDYHYDGFNKEEQISLLEKQLKIAEKYNIPVIIHSRNATLDTINILKKYHVKGVIHSFSGSLEDALTYIKMGFLIGVNGIITFKNENISNIIKEIPLEYLLLETDSPYLTPVPFRGQQNDPSHIIEIVKQLANLKNVDTNTIELVSNKNFDNLFL